METEAAHGKRILLVDDERGLREMLKVMLAKDEHTVVEANNGAEAFSLFTKGQFDLVLTDLEMPFVRGDELAMRIKQIAPQQRILMISAPGNKPGLRNPVDVVLTKPFDFAVLRKAIARLLPEGESSEAAAQVCLLAGESEPALK